MATVAKLNWENQAETQPPGKASKELNPQGVTELSRSSMAEMEPKEKDPPSLCSQGSALAQSSSQPSPQSGQLKLSQPICSSGSQAAICYAFASVGGRGGGRRRGQINSEALGRHTSNKLNAEDT